VTVYISAKDGSAIARKAVEDDEELDRIRVLNCSRTSSPRVAGRAIAVAWMKGRSRAFAIAKKIRQRPIVGAVGRLQRPVRRDPSRPRSSRAGERAETVEQNRARFLKTAQEGAALGRGER